MIPDPILRGQLFCLRRAQTNNGSLTLNAEACGELADSIGNLLAIIYEQQYQLKAYQNWTQTEKSEVDVEKP